MLKHTFGLAFLLSMAACASAQTQGSIGTTGTGSTTQPTVIAVASDVPPPPWADGVAATDAVPAGRYGPSAASTVYLGSGVYQNNPERDISATNITGPDAEFVRLYRTSLVAVGYASPGLSPGWSHNYDTRITASSEAGWGKLTLIWYNGAKEELIPVLKDGSPTGEMKPTGAPYIATGQPTTSPGRWNWFMLSFTHRDRWIFSPDTNNPNVYRLRRITATTGDPIDIAYDAAGRISKVTQSDGKLLLGLAYDANRYLSTATTYDQAGKPVTQVRYAFGPVGGITCLIAVSQVNRPEVVRWAYGYTAIGGRPFMNSVGVPNPSGKAELSVAYINYDPNGRVTSMVDANRNQRRYTYGGGGTKVEVRDPSGKVDDTWVQKVGR